MKVIVLSAGYGTRLYPLTKNKPKMLLPIAERPMIDYTIEKLNDVEEIDEYLVVTNHRFADQISEWAGSAPTDRPVKVIDDDTFSNDDRIGAIGDIRCVLGEENITEEYLVIASDNLFEFDPGALVAFYREKGGATVALKDMTGSPLISQYSVVNLDENGKVVRFEEKPANPKTFLISTCCYIFPADNRDMIDKYLAEGNNPDAPGYYIQWLYSKKDVYGFVFTESWFDIGDIDSYNEANALYSERLCRR